MTKNFDKTFGLIFQQFRESKGMTQEEAAEGVSSISQLSRFETGDSMPSFDKVYALLKNINVTFFEFTEEHNRFNDNQDPLLYTTDIANSFLSQDISKIKKILLNIQEQLKSFPYRKKYHIDKWHIEAILARLDPSYTIHSGDRGYLRIYLLKLKRWNLYDIQLLGHCLSIFRRDDELVDVVNKMLISTQAATNFHIVEGEVIRTTLNAIDVCFSRKNFDAAKNFIHYLKNWNINEYYLYEKFTLKYSEAYLNYQTGKTSSLEIMKQCQETAIFLECAATAAMIDKEIKEFKTTSNSKDSAQS